MSLQKNKQRPKKVMRSDTFRGLNEEFTNLSVQEMSQHVMAGQKQDKRYGCLILLLFFLAIGAVMGAGVYYYGPWMAETWGAAREVATSLWNLNFWEALTIIFTNRVSFLIMGLFIGIVVTLFVVLQLADILLDMVWDIVSSPFG